MKHSLTFLRPGKIFTGILFVVAGCGGGGGGGASDIFQAETLVQDAAFPVSIEQSPDGRIFYSEFSTGQIRIIQNGVLLPSPFATLEVVGDGNEGLLGIALDPDFASNRFVYSYSTAKNPTRNRVVRFRDRENRGIEPTVILDGLPFGGHDGGRLTFGHDKTLFVSVGDSGDPALAQQLTSNAGKILRINRDGSLPGGNPFGSSSVFALGLRNPFGLAVDPRDGTLFASDNGPECDDELNVVHPGANLGWRSEQVCGDDDDEFVRPIVTFNPSIAPTGIAFYGGDKFPALQGQLLVADFLTGTLRAFSVSPGSGDVSGEEVLIEGEFGGLIDVHVGVDGYIYLASTNAIIRLLPSVN